MINKKKKSKKNNKKLSSFVKILNLLMPYILAVLAAMILSSMLGFTKGDFAENILFGLFANFATYFLPIFLVYHAIMWHYDIKKGICARRVVCSIVSLIGFSTMQYLFQVGSNPELNEFSTEIFWELGKQSIGGGVVGGMVGILVKKIGVIWGAIIVALVLVFTLLQMFNITPAYMVRSMMKSKREQKGNKGDKAEKIKMPVRQSEPREEKIKRISPRKIAIYEEDDTLEVDEEVQEAYLDTTKKFLVDCTDDEDLDYEELNVSEINSKIGGIPSQLQPYDEDEDEDEEEDDFSVSASKYENDEIDGTITFELTKNDSYTETEENEPMDYDEEDEEKEVSYISDELLDKASSKKDDSLDVVSELISEPSKEEKQPKLTKAPKVNYTLPPLYFLKSQPDNSNSEDVRQELQENAKIIVETLNNFKAPTRIVDVTRGPTITRYELQPDKGVRVRTIEGLVDDIALNLAAKGIRIECPIPGKNAIGIEVPNRTISFVYLRDLLEDARFSRAPSKLTCGLGKSIAGENIYIDIESTPHLLVAGATGMGKSVCINSLLVSLLYKAKPDEVRLILIDPKRVELSNYNGIPHLLVPVVCEPKKSLGALQWAVTEMEERFMAIEEAGVRNIKEFNERVEKGYNAEKMARIVIVIDELADLKMAVPDIEGHITRLTQKARAAGIHIIIGTQRPSVDVLTGLIKNNIPSRIAFRVPSQVDSRTILDEVGAEKLVSKGDMLVKLVGALAPVRVQGAYVSVDEIQDVIDFWKESGPANYDESVMQQIDNNAAKLAKNDKDVGESEESGDTGAFDPEFYNALGLAVELGKISSSLLMRKLSLGFQRASRVIDQMEECGYIGEANGPKPRDVLITKEDYQELMMRRNDE